MRSAVPCRLRPTLSSAATQVEAVAAKHHADVFETSAKVGTGVGDIFTVIVQRFHSRGVGGGSVGGNGVAVSGAQVREGGGCC